MATKPKPLTDEQFSEQVYDLYKGCAEFSGGELVDERIRNLNYYFGRPFGDERKGRSQVVSSDAQDVVEWLLPYLMKTFTGSQEVVRFTPQNGEDVELAEQATDYANYIFYRVNNGFLILYEWVKDALMLKNGHVKWFWEKNIRVEHSYYEGLTLQELLFEVRDPEVEIEQADSYVDPGYVEQVNNGAPPLPQGQEPMLYNVKIRREYDDGKIKIEVIPPEHFIVAKRHNSIDLATCNVCGHRERVSKSDLLAMGFDYDTVCALETGETDDFGMGEEEQSRDQEQMLGDDTDYGVSPENPTYFLDEIYCRFDKDGDGIVEIYKVHMVGNTMLAYEEIEEIPIASMTPIIMPHRFNGRAAIDLVVDIQHQKSTMMRQIFDSAYQSINPRMKVLNGLANLGDLMEVRPGGIVRVDDINAVEPLNVPFLGRDGFSVIEYLDSVKENRTGTSRYNQGMDANSLNKTAIGITRIMDASMGRQELMARVMAETGLTRLMRGIVHLTVKHNNKKQMVELRGKYVEVDPGDWRDMKNMVVNVGLGTGNTQEELQNLMGVAQLQEKATALGMVKPIHFWNTAQLIMEKLGHKDITSFFDQPDKNAKMPKPPNPAEIEAQKQIQLEEIKAKYSSQTELGKAKAEADATKYRISVQAKAEVESSKIKSEADVEKAVKIEAVRVAGELIKAGVKRDLKSLADDIDAKAASIVRPQEG